MCLVSVSFGQCVVWSQQKLGHFIDSFKNVFDGTLCTFSSSSAAPAAAQSSPILELQKQTLDILGRKCIAWQVSFNWNL
jgi:hypothetical protein